VIIAFDILATERLFTFRVIHCLRFKVSVLSVLLIKRFYGPSQ